MTLGDLETVVSRTGHERYRWLTSDANPDAWQREGYRALVAQMAAGGAPADPAAGKAAADETFDRAEAAPDRPQATMAELRDATKRGLSNCWFSEPASCGCSWRACHLLGRQINIYDCVKCLKTL